MGFVKDYDREIGDRVCSQLAIGKSLHVACLRVGYVQPETIMKWIRERPEFRQMYLIAKRESADFLAEEILDIADDARNDYMASLAGDDVAAYKFHGEHIQRSKLRVDVRKWMAARLDPKRFGEKLQHAGVSDLPPVQTAVLTKEDYQDLRREMLEHDDV